MPVVIFAEVSEGNNKLFGGKRRTLPFLLAFTAMALWVDKYRPHTFEKMELHSTLNTRLKRLAASGDLPHLMFCGPSGAGKKTRVLALLRELYGVSVEKVKAQQKTFQFTEPKVNLELTILFSNHHMELTPADAGYRDSLVVQSVIKEMAASIPITDNLSDRRTFKVIVLNEVERLSKNAQHALVRNHLMPLDMPSY